MRTGVSPAPWAPIGRFAHETNLRFFSSRRARNKFATRAAFFPSFEQKAKLISMSMNYQGATIATQQIMFNQCQGLTSELKTRLPIQST